jgi:hypothetical protein
VPEPIAEKSSTTSYTIIFAAAFLLLAVVGVVVYVVVNRRRKQEQLDDEWKNKVGSFGEDTPTVDEVSSRSEETIDTFEIPSDALGRLTVTGSDDKTMMSQHFDLINRRTTLGRKADNDIVFPEDKPVSRHHALIEERNGGLFLTEVEDVETSKRPVYGTFVNEREVGSESILLQNGDEIRLGKRLVLKFEAGKTSSGDGITYDGLSGDTMDTQTV